MSACSMLRKSGYIEVLCHMEPEDFFLYDSLPRYEVTCQHQGKSREVCSFLIT